MHMHICLHMYTYTHKVMENKGWAEVGPQKRFGISYSGVNSPLYLFGQYHKEDATDQHFSKN